MSGTSDEPCTPEDIFGIFGVDGIVLGIGFPRDLDWGNVQCR
jgi:hypothetical protein